MKTIILNGSPKGNVDKSASYFLAQAFVSEMEQPCEIRSIVREDTEALIKYIEDFDNIIVFTPNYIQHLNYKYLGTVAKGECAGIAIMPNMFKKIAKRFAAFGKDFEQTGAFSEKFIKEFAEPYELSKSTVKRLNMFNKIGISKIGWHKMQKKHGGYKNRLDRPFLSEYHR